MTAQSRFSRLKPSNWTSRTRQGVAAAAAGALVGFVVVVGVFLLRDSVAGDRFDLVRFERTALWGKWLFHVGAPLRDDPASEDALARYFELNDPTSDEARRLKNTVERAIEGRIDAVLADLGLSARLRLPGSVFPPVAIQLTTPPRVLVQSPRGEIRRASVDLLRPNLTSSELEAIEERTEDRNPDRSALVVGAGGLATYPAMVTVRTYRSTVETAAHEWVHHYLFFYPLGIRYFASSDLTTINETVADIVGDEVADLVMERFGDPTQPDPPPAAPPGPQPAPTTPVYFETLRELRVEVDELLERGDVEAAEARMATVRDELQEDGFFFRRINQAFFAWTGTYAARPDAVDPLGSQIHEIRELSDSLTEFVELMREVTSRADVEALLAELRAERATNEG